MNDSLRFDYYYGIEAEQFSFYRVPRMLIKDERFKDLSSDAKLLYGLMLDRMALSMKNGWFDEENRAYIHYTLDNIMEDLGCAKEKCSKILAELDSKKGIGLIEKKRQGLGRPDIIYVKNFAVFEEKETDESASNTDVSTEVRKSNFKKSENRTSRGSEIELQEVGESNFKKYGNRTSRSTEIELAEVRFSNTNYTDNNYTEMSYINPSNQSVGDEGEEGYDEMSACISIIKENIEYDSIMQNQQWKDRELYEELFEIICEVVCVKRKKIRIGGEDYPYELVKSKFMKLNSSHLFYVIECMQNTTSRITNIKLYMLTALYNAPNTMNHYYQQSVQHDMYGGGWKEKGIV